MKILQTVKYYDPSHGGMESVVKNLVDGVLNISNRHEFTIYANNHVSSWKRTKVISPGITCIKEATPLLFRSQPVSIRYPALKELLANTDIVHHHYPFPNMEIALLKHIEILKNKRLILTWHANIKNSRWSWISSYYDPLIIKLLDVAESIVVTSPQLLDASKVLKHYINKVKIIPLSFSGTTTIYNPPIRLLPAKRKFRLLFVGKLRAYKGVDFLITAIKNLDVDLTIVGSGEQEIVLKKLVEELGIGQKVCFLQNMSNSELKVEFQKADLFILPSINEAEAFGVVQLEAMSNGLPVINTWLDSGVPHVSLDGFTGKTVNPGNSRELETAIESIMKDPTLYSNFSKNSIERSKLFTMQAMAENYLSLYD